jgi:response regulator RpfG family c-di-GMP phosphodiesterase
MENFMFEQINFCLALSNQNTSKMISSVLLNMGIVAYIAESIDAVESILANNTIDFLFLDFDFANNASFILLDSIKKNEKYSKMFVIGTSINSNANFIKQIQKYFLISFMVKPLTPEILKDKFQNIIYKFKNHFPERQHVRVEPAEDELMRISFQLKDQKFLSAKVVNVSLGGVAAEFFTEINSRDMQPGFLIEHLNFMAGNKEIDVDCKIINNSRKFISFKFTHFYKNSYENLLTYIMKKLSV